MSRDAHVHTATVRLDDGVDPAAVGAAVTTELCGHWEHDGPCRWPHHNGIVPHGDGFAMRIVFVAPDEDVGEITTRIDAALHAMPGCAVVDAAPDVLAPAEVPLAGRLANGPFADG